MAEGARREGLPTWATVTISVAGIVATLLAAIAANFDDSATRLPGARLGATKPHAAPSARDIESVASQLGAWGHQRQPGCLHYSLG